MMNFKKNQNNAVCSMDCKNCPHGASQPNPMDDPMFEKSIAMLHNWVMLEAIREDHPKERIVMVILPGAGGELLTEDGSRDIFEDVYDEMEAKLTCQGVFTLAKPTSALLLNQSLKWLVSARERLRRMEEKATSVEEKMEEIRLVNRAKWLLIEQLKMTEAEAHRHIEKQAMDRCTTRREIALGIIKTYA